MRSSGCGFLQQLEPVSAAYNMAFGVRLRGELDGRRWSGALDEMVERHEALRTTFVEVEGKPVQRMCAAELRVSSGGGGSSAASGRGARRRS